MRLVRPTVVALLLLSGGGLASAQEMTPAEQAVRDAEALRSRQMSGVERATSRTQVSLVNGDLGADSEAERRRIADRLAAEQKAREDAKSKSRAPWLVPAAVVVGILGLIALFRRRS